MAYNGPSFGIAPSTALAPCPGCGSGALHIRQMQRDPFAMRDSATIACGRCGYALDLEGPSGFDVAKEMAVLIQTGQLSPQVSAAAYAPTSLTTGIFATGGIPPSYFGVGASAPVAPPEPESESPGPELRSFSGSFVGYRAWNIYHWALRGTGVGTAWQPGVNEASCIYHSHPAPHDGCECGMYALARFDDPSGWWTNADVLGAIEAWADPDEDGNHDRFFIHSTGFRAQYAKVILLATDDAYPRAKNAAIRALASEHSADVCKREHLGDAAREHGQLVPDDALKWAREGDEGSEVGQVFARMAKAMNQFGVSSVAQQQAFHRMLSSVPQPVAPKPVAPGSKGVKQRLGHSGAPGPGTGNWRKGDRVKDSRSVIWQCVKGGRPGAWAREAEAP